MKRLLRAAKRRLITFPVFPLLNLPFRAFDTWQRYIGPVVGNWLRWLFASRADSNFTYHLTAHCRTNLAASVAGLLGKGFDEIEGYFQEIENDHEFDAHMRAACGAPIRKSIARTRLPSLGAALSGTR